VTTIAGKSFDMSSLQGRWVVVNFFASWCPPCQQEEPQLVTFARDHVGVGAPTLLGIVYDDSASNALSFMRSAGATWTAVVDPGALKIAYGVTGPPETFVVAPTGAVVAHYIGPVTASDLDQVISRGVAAGY
jgi:cytochrome c biogenesis protein CcmG/thiol:disulfide interchange protein DsbE